MSCLLLDTKAAVERAKAAGRKRLPSTVLAELHASYRAVIELGYEKNPGLVVQGDGAQPKRTKAQNLLLRLDERESEVLGSRKTSGFHSITRLRAGPANDQAPAED